MVRARQPSPAANRSDLAVPNVQAPAAVYGERQQQQVAQRAVPVAAPPAAPAPASNASQPLSAAPIGPSGGAQGGLPPVSGPGILPFLHPSNRPNEPVTAGLPTGAGPGPEALTGVGAVAANQSVEQGTLKNLLTSLANAPMSSGAIRDLAAVASAG